MSAYGHMLICLSASVPGATSETKSKVERWLWRSESKVIIPLIASLVKAAVGPIKVVCILLLWVFFCLCYFWF